MEPDPTGGPSRDPSAGPSPRRGHDPEPIPARHRDGPPRERASVELRAGSGRRDAHGGEPACDPDVDQPWLREPLGAKTSVVVREDLGGVPPAERLSVCAPLD